MLVNRLSLSLPWKTDRLGMTGTLNHKTITTNNSTDTDVECNSNDVIMDLFCWLVLWRFVPLQVHTMFGARRFHHTASSSIASSYQEGFVHR